MIEAKVMLDASGLAGVLEEFRVALAQQQASIERHESALLTFERKTSSEVGELREKLEARQEVVGSERRRLEAKIASAVEGVRQIRIEWTFHRAATKINEWSRTRSRRVKGRRFERWREVARLESARERRRQGVVRQVVARLSHRQTALAMDRWRPECRRRLGLARIFESLVSRRSRAFRHWWEAAIMVPLEEANAEHDAAAAVCEAATRPYATAVAAAANRGCLERPPRVLDRQARRNVSDESSAFDARVFALLHSFRDSARRDLETYVDRAVASSGDSARRNLETYVDRAVATERERSRRESEEAINHRVEEEARAEDFFSEVASKIESATSRETRDAETRCLEGSRRDIEALEERVDEKVAAAAAADDASATALARALSSHSTRRASRAVGLASDVRVLGDAMRNQLEDIRDRIDAAPPRPDPARVAETVSGAYEGRPGREREARPARRVAPRNPRGDLREGARAARGSESKPRTARAPRDDRATECGVDAVAERRSEIVAAFIADLRAACVAQRPHAGALRLEARVRVCKRFATIVDAALSVYDQVVSDAKTLLGRVPVRVACNRPLPTKHRFFFESTFEALRAAEGPPPPARPTSPGIWPGAFLEKMEKGNAAAQAGDFESAIRHFRTVPESPQALESAAQCLIMVGDDQGAVEAARQAVELAPEWGPGWVTLGRAALNLRHFGDAVSCLRRGAALGGGEEEEEEETDDLETATLLARKASEKIASVGGVAVRLQEWRDVETTGAVIWECGVVLAHFLRKEEVAGRRVVDLGSGCGVVGLAAAALGARAVCTDQRDVVEGVLRANVERSGLSAVAKVFDWTDPYFFFREEEEEEKFPVVVAADVVYRDSSARPFVEALAHVLHPQGTAYLAHKRRRPHVDAALLDALDDAFLVRRCST
ncbi:hypothetical protein CTAYLR_008010 [Chrysophaeum taylorii]|uniref:Uncharacterized protein n=1 Tax=Chrysophaeum taylorii TaxID=2483200 RepID=A0AAD7UBQ8_9STRA|nr:hypothetical protein CTAYLR_008010 [Chrysophaeum taylorii]